MVNNQDNRPLADDNAMDDHTTDSAQRPVPWPRGRGYLQRLRSGLPFLMGIAATLVGLYIYNLLVPPPDPLTQRDIENSVIEAMASATPSPPYAQFVYQEILPSMVFIETSDAAPTTGDIAQAQPSAPLDQGSDKSPLGSAYQIANPVGYLYQEDEEAPEQSETDPLRIASGVVINAEGAILTALHVVENAGYIKVTFADGTESEGVLVAAEPDNDIAVLAVDQLPETFAPAILGNPNAMRIGDEAYVVGNPLGLTGSMSAGVISGFDRSFTPTNLGYPLTRLIQFDAAVNPGTSGGPLLNRNGEVIGIVVALVNPVGQAAFSGIGLAVRIDEAAGGAGGAPPQ